MRNRLYHCLHIDWHYAVDPDENNIQPSMAWSHLVEKKRAVTVDLVGGCGVQSMKVERLKHKQNQSIISFHSMKSYISWAHTETVHPAPVTPQFTAQIVLTSAFFSIPLSMWGSTEHFTVPWKVFYTGPQLITDQSDWVKKRKSAWRIQNFHLLSISYSNVAIMC